jgi:TrmH family RNA methyltransferase
MLSKNEAKYIQSLCHKKERQEEGLFIAEGPKIIEELAKSNFVIKKVFALSNWETPDFSGKVEVVEVSEAELHKISNLQTPNQVVAIVQQKLQNAPPVIINQLSIVLDGIQDPGNLGTIIRIADWFGISQIICNSDTVELYNSKVIQSTMGSFVRVNVWYEDTVTLLKTAGVPVLGAVLNGKSIYEIEKPREGILVIGNESKGISGEVMKCISCPVTIPRIGGAESLNAAVATGIILSYLVG